MDDLPDYLPPRDKLLDTELKILKKSNEHLTERIKVFEKRLDFVGDAQARMAIEQEALIKSCRFIIEMGNRLLEHKLTANQIKKADDKPKDDSGIA